MKFEKHMIAISGNEYLLRCEVNGRLVEVEVDAHSPNMFPVVSLALDNVEFSNCELVRLYGEKKIPLIAHKFESLSEAPSFLLQRDLNQFEEDAEEALFEELQTL